MTTTTTTTTLLPLQPDAMTPAQRAAVSYLARYSGHTHALYASRLRRWFAWCETNGLDALVGIQRAHIELFSRHLGESGLMASVNIYDATRHSMITQLSAAALLRRTR